MAQLYSTVVELPTPVLGGGTADLAGGAAERSHDAEVLLPGATLLDAAQQPWERVQVGPDGRSLWVWFTGGATPCYGLGRVELVDADGRADAGAHGGPSDTLAMCVAIAVRTARRSPCPTPSCWAGPSDARPPPRPRARGSWSWGRHALLPSGSTLGPGPQSVSRAVAGVVAASAFDDAAIPVAPTPGAIVDP